MAGAQHVPFCSVSEMGVIARDQLIGIMSLAGLSVNAPAIHASSQLPSPITSSNRETEARGLTVSVASPVASQISRLVAVERAAYLSFTRWAARRYECSWP